MQQNLRQILLLFLNDNNMSISKNVGGMSTYLSAPGQQNPTQE